MASEACGKDKVPVIPGPRQYEHANAAVQRSATVLDQLRTRASVVLSSMAIVASFLGTRTDKHGTLVWLAFGVIAFGMICCVGVMWPARDRGPMLDSAELRSRNGPEDWLPFYAGTRRFKSTVSQRDFADMATTPVTVEAVDEKIIGLLWQAHLLNQRTINRRTDLFQVACLALVAEVVVLALLVAPG